MAEKASALGLRQTGRWLWGQLTSMRTALVLLFLVAAAAIPGSLVPQSSQSSIKVSDFAKAHPALDRIYQPLGMYHVYTSVWFSAIYLLLFISLMGCIVPRLITQVKALRREPPRVPARLDRLPGHRSVEVRTGEVAEPDAEKAAADGATSTGGDDVEQIGQRARTWLEANHYRVVSDPDGSLRAERGRHRETGNLVFHVFLVVLLIAIAWNTLWGYKGNAVVVEGQGFSNNITQFDEFHAGAAVNSDRLQPFSLKLKSFIARFETGPVQRGAAREFTGKVALTTENGTQDRTLTVNKPLTVGSTKIHLLGHGYAATVKVTDGDGNVAYSGPVTFVPQDGNFTSIGVIKVPDARPQRLAFEGYFLPTGTVGKSGPVSVFPDAYNPQLYLNAWAGSPAKETGTPQNVYVLDKTGLTQIKDGKKPVSFMLSPGKGYKLPGGQGSIEFTGWHRWAKIQVSSAPGLPLAFGSLLIAVAGLCVSLFTRPRRLWLRVRRGEGGRLAIEVGGLDRADSRAGLDDDVNDLVDAARGDLADAVGGDPEKADHPGAGATVSPTTSEEDS